MRIVLLIILAATFFAFGVWAHFRAMRYLAVGVTPKDVAWNPDRGDDAGWDRLESLYAPQGWRLRRRGMLSLALCALAVLLALIELVF